jgi:cation:H+ antiporter
LESLILVLAAATSVWWAMRVDGLADLEQTVDADIAQTGQQSTPKSVVFVTGGIGLLVLGAEGLIWGGVGLADVFGVPEAVVALTVTSIGTGLPEITATVLAVARRDTDMAVGNVVGSNLLNIGLVLGLSGLIAPIDSAGVGLLPLGLMVVLSLVLAALAWRPGYIARWVGAALLAAFTAYTVLLVQ